MVAPHKEALQPWRPRIWRPHTHTRCGPMLHMAAPLFKDMVAPRKEALQLWRTHTRCGSHAWLIECVCVRIYILRLLNPL